MEAKIVKWEAERVQCIGSRKHRKCMVGIDEAGIRHYMPLKSSWARTQDTVKIYENTHTRGIQGCPGVSRDEVERMNDEDLRIYWRS